MIFFAVFPFIVLFVAFLIWMPITLYTRKRIYMSQYFIATVTILYFLIVPNITKSCFSVFNCKDIEEKGLYLVDDLEIECWKDRHLFYSMTVGLGMIIVWILMVPIITLSYLFRKIRFKLHKVHNRIRFGFLYNGFHKRTFYWEFVILYRKVAVIAISVFLTNISIPA